MGGKEILARNQEVPIVWNNRGERFNGPLKQGCHEYVAIRSAHLSNQHRVNKIWYEFSLAHELVRRVEVQAGKVSHRARLGLLRMSTGSSRNRHMNIS